MFLGLAAGGSARADEARELAARLLDETVSREGREAIVREHPELAARLLAEMTAGLAPGSPEEARRIPWIWRVAIAAARRDEGPEVLRILDVALPAPGAPLDDWRAVVVGGGIINGLTLAGRWPAERIEGLLKGHAGLEARWRRAIDLAAGKADDEAVTTGTRYDALRMLGVEPWDRCGAHLFRYLLKGVHPELQQGAISALGDVRSPAVGQALLSGLAHYSAQNRAFLLDALLRDEGRAAALLDAVAAGRLTPDDLGKARVEASGTTPPARSAPARRSSSRGSDDSTTGAGRCPVVKQ